MAAIVLPGRLAAVAASRPGAASRRRQMTDLGAMKTELLRRQAEYRDHPERFVRMDESNLKGMFDRIANARARFTSA